MAIYHAHFSKVQRSKGQNAIASAAYVGATCLQKLDGSLADYRKKKGVSGSKVILPSYVSSSQVVTSQKLWAMAEQSENRKNSTTARRGDFALPCEFTEEECLAVGYAYSQDIADRYGVVVDVHFHDLDKQNPHIDLMWTSRVFDGEKLTNKTRILDDKATGTQEFLWLRERWATRVNEKLASYGTHIDHRSYKDQGLEKIATKHLGREMTALERKGISTDLGEYNNDIRELNVLHEVKNKINKEIAQIQEQLKELSNESTQQKICRTRQEYSHIGTQNFTMGGRGHILPSADRGTGSSGISSSFSERAEPQESNTTVLNDGRGNRSRICQNEETNNEITNGIARAQGNTSSLIEPSFSIEGIYGEHSTANGQPYNKAQPNDHRDRRQLEETIEWGRTASPRNSGSSDQGINQYPQQIGQIGNSIPNTQNSEHELSSLQTDSSIHDTVKELQKWGFLISSPRPLPKIQDSKEIKDLASQISAQKTIKAIHEQFKHYDNKYDLLLKQSISPQTIQKDTSINSDQILKRWNLLENVSLTLPTILDNNELVENIRNISTSKTFVEIQETLQKIQNDYTLNTLLKEIENDRKHHRKTEKSETWQTTQKPECESNGEKDFDDYPDSSNSTDIPDIINVSNNNNNIESRSNYSENGNSTHDKPNYTSDGTNNDDKSNNTPAPDDDEEDTEFTPWL